MSDESTNLDDVTSSDPPIPPDSTESRAIVQGARLGPYCLERQLARRRFEDSPWVWQVYNVEADRIEVLKIYEWPLLSEEKRAHVTFEAQMAEAWGVLPGIVDAYFTGRVSQFFVIAMESLAENVKEYVDGYEDQRHRSRSEQGRHIGWVARISESVQVMHEAGVIHRDITRGNMLVSMDHRAAKLCDFSTSAAVPEGGEVLDKALTGTRREMAPEQQRGRFNRAGDQCQLAYVSWYLMTGRTFPDDPDYILRPSVRRVLQRGGDQDPAQRYASVAEFGHTLEAAFEHLDRGVLVASRALERSHLSVLARLAWLLLGVAWCIGLLITPLAARTGHGFLGRFFLLGGALALAVGLCGPILLLTGRLRTDSGIWSGASIPMRLLMKPWLSTAVAGTGVASYWLVARSGLYDHPWLAPGILFALVFVTELVVAFVTGVGPREGAGVQWYIDALLGRPSRKTLIALATTAALLAPPSIIATVRVFHALQGEQDRRAQQTLSPALTPADIASSAGNSVAYFESRLMGLDGTEVCRQLSPQHPWRRHRSLDACIETAHRVGRRNRRRLLRPALLRTVARIGPSGRVTTRVPAGGGAHSTALTGLTSRGSGHVPVVDFYSPPVKVHVISAHLAMVDAGELDGTILRYTVAAASDNNFTVVEWRRRAGSRRFLGRPPASATGE